MTVPVTVIAEPDADTPYGYLMVHFMEDAAGYAEKIYLDVSDGDNPERWDPLNGGEAILASNASTTGVRDPYLTYNPDTGTYYIIATDLRVFGGDDAGWGAWTTNYSTRMNIWSSTDLVTWSDLSQFDVALDETGAEIPDAVKLGQMWAPEATWVPHYVNADGTTGAFIVYWSSQYGGTQHTMWGATRDFTQVDWHYGGLFTDNNGSSTIDATIIQNELPDGTLRTYRVILDYGGPNLVLQSTDAQDWWTAPHSAWTTIQSNIGQARYGSVEGPAMFKDHNQDRWYLFVDDLPVPGYRPMVTGDLDAGFDYLDAPNYHLRTFTKHGGVIGLTKADYDRIRQADAESVVTEDLGTVTVTEGAQEGDVTSLLPDAEVSLHSPDSDGATTAELPVRWDLADADLATAGTYEIVGVVQSIADNANTWTGPNGEGVWRATHSAADRPFARSNALTVTATVVVEADVVPISFVDVPPGVQFYDEITWLAGQGVTTGWELPDGSREFRPVTPVKRDAMAAFLYRLAGSPAFTAPTTSPFTDVPTTNQVYKEISWLAAEGISTGWAQPDGSKRFEPLSDVGRDAMAVFLYRYAEVTGYTAPATSAFVDVPTSNVFYKEISWLASEGISTGYPLAGGAKEFRPLGSVNRDAMAAFMYRLSHLS